MAAGPCSAAAALLLAVVAVASAVANGYSKELPVTKVVQLLQAMQEDLQTEYKEDKETHEALECWCKKNEEEKGESIEKAKQQIDSLEATIESSAGRVGELTVGIEQTKKTLAESEQALAEAIEIRKEEAAAFHEQEKELLVCVELLHGAITALSKHHPAMLQADSEVAALMPKLRHLIHKHLNLLGFLRTSSYKEAFLRFLDAHADLLDPDIGSRATLLQRSASARRQPIFKSYAPQSGQIIGVLKQMKDAFEADLPEIQKTEMKKATDFAALKGEKTSEIAQLKSQLKSMAQELATSKETLFTAKNDLEDFRASLSADQQFLLKLQDSCMTGDAEWEKRSKLRLEEIQAVSEAIGILSTDAARDAQQATFGFIQLASIHTPNKLALGDRHSSKGIALRSKATSILARMAARSPELLALVQIAKTDPFAKVIEAIDGLLSKLNMEQADEVKHHDLCINQLHENEVETERTKAELKTLEAKIADLESKVTVLSEEIASLKQEIHELQVELQRASEDRKAENHEFRKTIADQMTMVSALEAALSKLSAFYNAASLVQKAPATGEQTIVLTTFAPPEFQDYHTSGSSNHVMTLLEKLVGEAQVVVDGSRHAEQEAENAYEALIGETNDSVQAKSRMVTDKGEELAAVQEEKDQALADKERTIQDLEALAGTKGELHKQCDFLLKNFNARQEARAAEMEGLGEVKAILRGMKGE